MRTAIDKYKDYADLGYLGPQKLGTNNWPETLDILVEGVKLPGPDGKKMRFLRRIPMDPFTGKAEWGLRSDQDDPKSLELGRPVRLRCVQQDHGKGGRWNALLRMVADDGASARPARAASLSSN